MLNTTSYYLSSNSYPHYTSTIIAQPTPSIRHDLLYYWLVCNALEVPLTWHTLILDTLITWPLTSEWTSLICHTTMRRHSINFLYNPGHVILRCLEVVTVANTSEGSMQEQDWARVLDNTDVEPGSLRIPILDSSLCSLKIELQMETLNPFSNVSNNSINTYIHHVSGFKCGNTEITTNDSV